MPWQAPDFEEVNLSSEVTSYVNTDDDVHRSERPRDDVSAVAVESR